MCVTVHGYIFLYHFVKKCGLLDPFIDRFVVSSFFRSVVRQQYCQVSREMDCNGAGAPTGHPRDAGNPGHGMSTGDIH